MTKEYIKSPMNYIGNKYRILEQIQCYFPKKINTMVDLFCGGCDVTINTKANQNYANDINYHVIEIFSEFQKHSSDYILGYIDGTIDKWNLSKTDLDAYLKFREHYNQTRAPLDLYVLMCFSFNYQFRFNSKHEFNNPFGKNRSSFNSVMRNNLQKIVERICDVHFTSQDFHLFNYDILKKDDFLYADPPYLITCGTYNDGKRGFKGWTDKDEIDLYNILSDLDKSGVKFALSNVIEHKGIKNNILEDWCAQHNYYLHDIKFNYKNCNYHTKNTDKITREVLITNY